MKAAIYSRKSKFTGKGDSIENQIQLCKDYGKSHFNLQDEDLIIYEDEGFSGGNIDRPQFQLMLKDIKAKKLDMLICYRLDRISRNVADFSSTLELLQQYNVSFVSIRESFDTSTPMGKAMVYIASVFAQLERETIAERIRDNMLQLAKTGRWLGGTTPTGYESVPVMFTTPDGKQRKLFKLSPIPNELEVVKLLFDKYLELKSITKLESFCIQNDIKTRNGVDYTRYSLRFLLGNPVYAVADKQMYEFLEDNGYEVYSSKEEFSEQFGVMAYNKTNQSTSSARFRDMSEWIIAVGAHEGIISSEKWIKVQKLLLQNKSKSYRKVKNTSCLLSGILRCGNCGSFMRPRTHRRNKEGVLLFSYMCEMKEKSKKKRCDVKNVSGNQLDELVVQEIKKLSDGNSGLHRTISNDKLSIQTAQDSIRSELIVLESNIKNNDQAISNLVASLSQGQNSAAAKYIIGQIEELDKQTAQMKERLLKLKDLQENNQLKESGLDVMKDMLSAFVNSVNDIDIEAKRTFIRSIVEKILWDGENIEIIMFGANSEKKQIPQTEV